MKKTRLMWRVFELSTLLLTMSPDLLGAEAPGFIRGEEAPRSIEEEEIEEIAGEAGTAKD